MKQEAISGEMLVAEVLAQAPNAREIFRKHGIDPVTYCGPTVNILRLDEIPSHCKLDDLEDLLAELNQDMEQPDSSA